MYASPVCGANPHSFIAQDGSRTVIPLSKIFCLPRSLLSRKTVSRAFLLHPTPPNSSVFLELATPATLMGLVSTSSVLLVRRFSPSKAKIRMSMRTTLPRRQVGTTWTMVSGSIVFSVVTVSAEETSLNDSVILLGRHSPTRIP